ncbi:MAG: 5-dehydro-2-deoxygluconokinase, partial [Acidimicrobiia bacterium]|nr:5-dehydro-2-deoxygluconokinase [Acidimicrobiia bacterium]
MEYDMAGATAPALDLICLGRVNLDLYAEQEGAPLGDVQSFRKYVGGSAANICIGTARLGLKSAMVGRVGDEPMGAFIRRTIADQGADVRYLRLDPDRLTGVVTVSVRESEGFPRIFFYEDTADLATDETDIDPDYIAASKALLITGTYFARRHLETATRKAVRAAKAAGRRVVLDIDYRPVLWGLAEHGAGGEMFIASREVTERIQSILPECDLIVGTEEEIRIAGGSSDTTEAVRSIRSHSEAVIVLKVGALGCLIFDGPIPDDLDDGLPGPGVPVEVFNTVGAGDAFMSGFLRGWLAGEPLERCAQLANACGALVVSRHGCAPAMPSWEELQYFLSRIGELRRPREDEWLEHLHWVTNRRGEWPTLCVLAVDHRWQLEELADAAGAPRERIRKLKRLIVRAFSRTAAGRHDAGILLDDIYGRDMLEELSGSGVWIARAIEVAGSIPFKFAGRPNVDTTLRTWPTEHVAKVMVYAHPGDGEPVRAAQERRLGRLADACHAQDREFLVELQAPPGAAYDERGVAPAVDWVYSLDIRPDWWKLPPDHNPVSWKAVGDIIRRHDPYCRGVLVLGQSGGTAAITAAMAAATTE